MNRALLGALPLVLFAAGCSGGTAAPVAAATLSASPSDSPFPSPSGPGAAECAAIDAAWVGFKESTLGARDLGQMGDAVSALATVALKYYDDDPLAARLAGDLDTLGAAIIRDRSAVLGIGGQSAASTGAEMDADAAVVGSDHQAIVSACGG